MIDIHTHLLPWVDDGPRELAEAVAWLAAHAGDGVRTVVLTPDIHPGRFDNTLSTLEPRFEAFRRYVASRGVDIDLRLGAQVHLNAESRALVDAGEVPFIGRWAGRPVMLVEFSDAGIPDDAFDSIAFLLSRDIVPMVAHPECNKEVKVAYERMRPFVEAGCMLQVTAASLVGMLGARAQDAAWRIVESGWATAVATGLFQHGPRQPSMRQAREALRRRLGDAVAESLMRDRPLEIIDAPAGASTLVSSPSVTGQAAMVEPMLPLPGASVHDAAAPRMPVARGRRIGRAAGAAGRSTTLRGEDESLAVDA